MNYAQDNFDISEVLLNYENARIKDILHDEFYSLNSYEQQIAILFYLIAEDNIATLLKDILLNVDVSFALLNQESLILQKKSLSEDLVVKEGNRRTCCLKLILGGQKLLDELELAKANMVGINIKYINKFKNNIPSIKKDLIKLEADGIDKERFKYVRCIIYDESAESDSILDVLLRKMHVTRKRDWESVDQRLYDYNTILGIMKDNNEDIVNAIKIYISSSSELDNVSKSQINDVKKDFAKASFYHYILGRIKSGAIKGEPSELKERLRKSFLPICEVMFFNICKIYSITYRTEVNQGVEKFILSQEAGSKEVNIVALIDEIASKIFNMEKQKPLSSTYFKGSEAFKLFFKEIISKYSSSDVNEHPVQEVVVDNGIFLSNGSDKLIVEVPTLTAIDLHDYVQKVVYNGVEVKKEDLEIFETDTPISNDYEMQVRDKETIIVFTYDRKLKATLNLSFVAPHSPKIQVKEKLLPVLVRSNAAFNFTSLSESLQNEINRISIKDYPYTVSTVLRVYWETTSWDLYASKKIPLKSPSNNFKLVEEISNHIALNLRSRQQLEPFAAYYGISVDASKDIVHPLLVQNELFSNYFSSLNSPIHGQHETVVRKISELGLVTAKWITIINYLLNA